jgi:hypothetical protein
MLSPAVHRYVRYVEAAAVGALLVFGLLTYYELNQLRKVPVALPNYEFEITSGSDPIVRTRGTWISGSGIPGPVQTTTIECKKFTMRCTESSASIVFLEGKGLLESKLTEFEIDRWTERQIVAKPVIERCLLRTLSIDIPERRALSRFSTNPEDSRCEQKPDRAYELVAGYKVREQR